MSRSRTHTDAAHARHPAIPEREYRIVIVGRAGDRNELSRFTSFIAAERVRRFLPSVADAELRIESLEVERR